MSTQAGPFSGKQLGQYLLRECLGRGGMGEVYLAQDTSGERAVILKLLSERLLATPQQRERFLQDAQAAARLSHPNIVQVYAAQADTAPAFLVMEYVKGSTLDKVVRPDQPMLWQHALDIVAQAAAALAHAHQNGVLHRNITPQKLLIDRERNVRVGDFGLGGVLDAACDLSDAQSPAGNLCYRSPEQCGAGEVGPASDLYSLGIVFFEMLTGRLPFQAKSPEEAAQYILNAPMPQLQAMGIAVPPVIQALLDKLTARQPEERYAAASEVLEDITLMRNRQTPPRLVHTLAVDRPRHHAIVEIPGKESESGLFSSSVLGGGPPAPLPPHATASPRSGGIPWKLIAIGAAVLTVGIVVALLVLAR